MKRQSIILTFIPWIIFSSSTGFISFLSGSVIALLLNIVIARDSILKGAILEIGGCIFFSAMLIVGFFLHHGDTFTQHPNLWSNIAMSMIMLGSVAINRPFTKQYSDKGNHKLHMHLSAIWGSLLVLATFFSIAHAYFGLSNTMSIIGTVIAIFLGIKANSFYPKWFHQKKTDEVEI